MKSQYGILGEANMVSRKESFDTVNKELEHLGSTTNTDKDLEAALLQLCSQADSTEGAAEALQAMGYLPYQRRIMHHPSGQVRREPKMGPSVTNGYLERRNA